MLVEVQRLILHGEVQRGSQMLLLLLTHDLLQQGPLFHLRVVTLNLGGHRAVETWSDQLPVYYQVDRNVKD